MNLPSPLLNLIKKVMGKPTYPEYLQEFLEIDSLVYRGKYQDAYASLKDLRDNILDQFEDIEKQAYQFLFDFKEMEVQTKLGKSAELLLHAKQVQSKSEKMDNPIIQIGSELEVSNVLFVAGEYHSALEYLNQLNEKIEALKFYYPSHHWRYLARKHELLGKVYDKMANFSKAIEHLVAAVNIHTQIDTTADAQAELKYELGVIYAELGDQSQGVQYLLDAKGIYENLKFYSQLLKIHNNLGIIYRKASKLSEALDEFNKALEYSEKLSDQEKTAVIKSNIGLIYQDMGDLTSAERYMSEALEIFKEFNNRSAIASSYLILANVVTMKGNLDKALEYMNTSLKINTELEDKKSIAELYSNIGKIYTQRGDIEQAIQYTQSSLEIFENIGEREYIPQVAYALIQLYVQMGNKEAYGKNLKLLESLSKELNTKFAALLYKMGQAEILKHSERMLNRAEAQKILYELVDDGNLTLIHQQESMMSLAQLLLHELKLSPSEEALNEFKDIIERLYNSIQNPETQSVAQLPIQVQILMLRAKLGLLDLDMELAQSLLDDAINIANKYGFESLHSQAVAEKEAIKNEMLKYKKMVDTNASILDRLKQTQIEDYLKKAENILRR